MDFTAIATLSERRQPAAEAADKAMAESSHLSYMTNKRPPCHAAARL
jgi:hypothetical protein